VCGVHLVFAFFTMHLLMCTLHLQVVQIVGESMVVQVFKP
jgi:hypothetical protein